MQVIGEELKNLIKSEAELERTGEGICISAPGNSFKPEIQVTEDAIDLRIANKGFIMNRDYETLNTLSSRSFAPHFTEQKLTFDGYPLKPGEILYIGTVERISLKGSYIGRVSGRSTFARMGLSVNSTQDKFCGYNNAIVGLQLRNNSRQTLMIYPYQKLVQIMFYKTIGSANGTDSIYADESEYRLPRVLEKERTQYDTFVAAEIADKMSVKKNPVSKAITELEKSKNGIKFLNIVIGAIGTFCSAIIGFLQIDDGTKIGLLCMIGVIYLLISIPLNMLVDKE